MVLDREENPHLAFGAGPHRCLGSNLARMEFKVGVGEVLRRIPDYWIPDESKCRFAGTNITRGFTATARPIHARTPCWSVTSSPRTSHVSR